MIEFPSDGVAKNRFLEQLRAWFGTSEWKLVKIRIALDVYHLQLRQALGCTHNLRTRFGLRGECSLTREIVLAMLESGRVCSFPTFAAFEDELRLRLAVVKYAAGNFFEFGTGDETAWRNEEFWTSEGEGNDAYYRVRDDRRPREAVYDAFACTTRRYGVACKRALELTMANSFVDAYANNETALRRFDALYGHGAMRGDRFKDVFLKIAEDVPPSNLIPGEWLWFENPNYDAQLYEEEQQVLKGEITAEEGSNVIYLGGGRFCGLYENRTLRLARKLMIIHRWHDKIRERHGQKTWEQMTLGERKQLIAILLSGYHAGQCSSPRRKILKRLDELPRIDAEPRMPFRPEILQIDASSKRLQNTISESPIA